MCYDVCKCDEGKWEKYVGNNNADSSKYYFWNKVSINFFHSFPRNSIFQCLTADRRREGSTNTIGDNAEQLILYWVFFLMQFNWLNNWLYYNTDIRAEYVHKVSIRYDVWK